MIPELDDLRRQVQELRRSAGMTQQAVAEAAGVSQSFVAKLERGDTVPNHRDAAAVYNTLKAVDQEAETAAAEMMSTDVVAVAPDDTVAAASRTMKAQGFSQLPVVDGGDCVGSVTSRGLLDADEADPVRDYMAPAFPTVPPDTAQAAVAELLRSANAVLVRDETGIAGIVTAADLI